MRRNEFYDLADELEAACGDWENSEGLSEKALSELIAKVEEMDAKAVQIEDAEKLQKKRRLRKRYLLVLAAALILAMGTGVVGDRVWRSDSKDLERESEITTKVDNEEKDDILREEETIYQEIADKLGIVPMRLGYKPRGMIIDTYSISEDTGWVYINYVYNERLISIKMIKKSKESSSNLQWDGESRKIEGLQNVHGYENQIEAYCTDEENLTYTANISFGNGFYNLYGQFPDENEFLEILNGIYFKNM